MNNIEKNEKLLEQQILTIIENKMIKGGYREKYSKLKVIDIGNGIFALKSLNTKNIQGFYNQKGELIFNIHWVVENFGNGKTDQQDFKTGKEKIDKILQKKLGYKWYKDQTGYYHMVNIKTGEEIKQESNEYYNIFEMLLAIKLRDFGKKIYKFKGDFVERLADDTNIVYMALPKEDREEYINELIQGMIEQAETMVQFYTLKPIELIFLEKHNIITKEEYNKLKKKVYAFEYIKKLIENPVWNYVEGETKEYKINGKTYKIKTNGITEDELKLYLDLKIINKEDYEVLKTILEKQKIKQEEKEHINKTKKHISSLEDDVVG